MRHVLILVAGGRGIGLGHISRCGTLAGALVETGHAVSALVRGDAAARVVLERRGVPSRHVDRVDACLAREVAAACNAMLVVVDDYDAPDSLVDGLRAFAPARQVMILDDSRGRPTRADIVWNATPRPESMAYEQPPGSVAFLGPEYALARPGPGAHGRAHRPSAQRVLITAGASGARSFMADAVAVVRATLPKAHIDVLAGSFGYPPALPPDPRLALHRGVDDLYPFMLEADFAVAAAGQTAYELAASGTPAVLVPVAPNQQLYAEGLAGRGAALEGGRPGTPEFRRTLTAAVEQIAHDATLRRRLGGTGADLIDGRGPARLAAELTARLEEREHAQCG